MGSLTISNFFERFFGNNHLLRMKKISYFFSVYFFFIILISCNEQRNNRLLVLYQEDGQNIDLKSECMQILRASSYDFDIIGSQSQRLGDSLWQNNALIILSDPQILNPQWQSDIERYVQTGGTLLVPAEDINTYYWPWLHQAQTKNEKYFDGGEINFFQDSTNFRSLLKTVFEKMSIQADQVKSLQAPSDSRFTKIILDAEVNEPMELAVLPGGRVLFIEREGNFKVYDPEMRTTKLLHTFDVSTKGNYEDGMLGLTIDPNYEDNNWVYIYYSPKGGRPRQNLSRFVLAYKDSLILQSEKVILEVAVQRETCCHSGGSISFGPNGNLFLSTGDNTSSKESDGYSPLDQRPGRSPFDAQKGASNTHDLRGKILRITPKKDGTYTIPKGNLFSPDGTEGRPEIFAMGCRNPFRFSVDQRTGYVYWGDVGPDSGIDSELGPQSYDEWNQAKSPGNYGWPYFEANNKAYPILDFATKKIGLSQNPLQPINDSPNNTGARVLPPARSSMIWYPYGVSDIWPMLGKGSRSAMAGPIYYEPSTPSKTAFPEYYNGKLFIYEWARNWIKVVSFDNEWNMIKIEPFLSNEKFNKPIDMEFDREGNMYLLEYGANYFANNVEAKLVKIEYNRGNRAPYAVIQAAKTKGSVPFNATFSASQSFDYDPNDSLIFDWNLSDGRKFRGENISFTIDTAGIYEIALNVTDGDGGTATSFSQIIVGNAPPEISLKLDGNQSFYFGESKRNYNIEVTDLEDGSSSSGTINSDDIKVNFSYLPDVHDLALLGEAFYGNDLPIKGEQLIWDNDCSSCHAMQSASIGPSFNQIAERYNSTESNISMLALKIIQGGNGNWGHSLMAAHPDLSVNDAESMVEYILSVNDKNSESSFALDGAFLLSDFQNMTEKGIYVISVRYEDLGFEGIPAIESSKIQFLRAPYIQAEDYDISKNIEQQRPFGGSFAFVSSLRHGSYVGYDNIDLNGVTEILLKIMPISGGKIAIFQGDLKGKPLAELNIPSSNKNESWEEENFVDYSFAINESTDGSDVLFLMFTDVDETKVNMNLDQIIFKQK